METDLFSLERLLKKNIFKNVHSFIALKIMIVFETRARVQEEK